MGLYCGTVKYQCRPPKFGAPVHCFGRPVAGGLGQKQRCPRKGSSAESPSASTPVVMPPDPGIEFEPMVAGRREKPGVRVG